VPTFGYLLSSDLSWVLGFSALRGIGFGMVAVAGSALVAELVPATSRGRAVGWYGVAVGIPQVVFLPLGVWCADQFGFAPVFIASAVMSLLAIPAVCGLSGQRMEQGAGAGDAGDPENAGISSRYRGLAAPWMLLATTACALGGAATFLPLALETPAAAPVALFIVTSAIMVGRWLAGVRSDRHGVGQLLLVSVAGCAIGMAGFAIATEMTQGTMAMAIAAAVAFGLGFGALQNDTLVVMFQRAGPQGHGTASTAWNMAYDAGAGVGALGVGLVAQLVGLRGAFLVSALAIAAVAPLAWRESRLLRDIGHAAASSACPRSGQ
jgi:predicted MFS family arabinose efflux permease